MREPLERHHDVVAIDLPGFGQSPPQDGEFPTPARLADAVAATIEDLGLVRPAVVGNSLGGWVALELARRRGRVSCAVAIAPSGLETPPERAYVIALNELMRTRARMSVPFARPLAASAVARTVLLGGLRARPWRVAPQVAASELRDFGCSPAFQAALRASVGTRVPTGLSEIRVPVRILFGTLDTMLGAMTAPRFAAAIPGADLFPLPHAGHVPMDDVPDLLARAILEVTTDAAATSA